MEMFAILEDAGAFCQVVKPLHGMGFFLKLNK